jgi:hypothetical protein
MNFSDLSPAAQISLLLGITLLLLTGLRLLLKR